MSKPNRSRSHVSREVQRDGYEQAEQQIMSTLRHFPEYDLDRDQQEKVWRGIQQQMNRRNVTRHLRNIKKTIWAALVIVGGVMILFWQSQDQVQQTASTFWQELFPTGNHLTELGRTINLAYDEQQDLMHNNGIGQSRAIDDPDWQTRSKHEDHVKELILTRLTDKYGFRFEIDFREIVREDTILFATYIFVTENNHLYHGVTSMLEHETHYELKHTEIYLVTDEFPFTRYGASVGIFDGPDFDYTAGYVIDDSITTIELQYETGETDQTRVSPDNRTYFMYHRHELNENRVVLYKGLDAQSETVFEYDFR